MKKFALLFLCILLLPCFALADLTVSFLDVGQGDCTIIDCNGHKMIIDGGEKADYIYSYLDAHSIDAFDYVIATHPHKDHIGGLPAVLRKCSVYKIYSPVTDYDSPQFQDLKKYAQAEIIRPHRLDFFYLDEAIVTFLTDGSLVVEKGKENDVSLVLRIDYKQTSFLFMGDAEKSIENELPSEQLSADVLKVGHHGSSTASTADFLRRVHPDYAVISCGKGYGHPHQTVLDNLYQENVKMELYRTDLQGIITCKSDGYDITFETEKKAESDVFTAPEKK